MRASIFEKYQRLRLSRSRLAAWTWLRSIGIAAAVGVAYFLAAQLSNSFLITPETVIFWPAAGISSGLLISLWSIARWPVLAGVIVATAAVNLLRHLGVAATAAWVLGNAAEPLIIAGLMQHYFGAHFKIDRLYCVLGLFAAAVVGTAVASSWWTFVYYWLFASLNEPMATWLHWIVSDFAGIVSVAPLVIGLAAALQRPPPRRETIESVAALAVVGAMTAVTVSLPQELWETVVPAALVFPILLWLAARSQPVFAAAGAFIVSMTVALTGIYGLGHFGGAGLSIGVRILQTQTIILVVGFGTAVLAALFAERRESEARLARSNMMLERERDNKLMNMEAMAASIAHELKQPLTGIIGFGSTTLSSLGQTPPNLARAESNVKKIIASGEETNEMLDNMRALFGRAMIAKERIDVNGLVVDLLCALDSDFKSHRVATSVDLAHELPPIMGHKVQLQEVIINLLHNAIEAMDLVDDGHRVLKFGTRLSAGDTITITVEDTGPGFNPEKSDSIFDAFVTTKPHGMGLGLAICRRIVEQHGGQLSASSANPRGAIFRVTLPRPDLSSQDDSAIP